MSAVMQEERNLALHANRFKTAEYVRQLYRIVPPEGHTMDDIVKPDYWAHVAPKLRIGDHIEVFPDDQSFWADLLVISAHRLSAVVQVLQYVEIDANRVTEFPTGYNVEWKGPQHKFSILKGTSEDFVYVKDGFETKQEAQKALDDYLRQIGK